LFAKLAYSAGGLFKSEISMTVDTSFCSHSVNSVKARMVNLNSDKYCRLHTEHEQSRRHWWQLLTTVAT